MKCTRQPSWVKGKISDVWEVRLPQTLWKKVCQTSVLRKTTKSWVVRYCVKRLLAQKEIAYLRSSRLLLKNVKLAKTQGKDEMSHRHMLCLYGQDLRMIKEYASALNLTVTMLVRLALYWYIGRLQGKKVSQMCLFSTGLKDYQFVMSALTPAMDFHSQCHTVIFHYDPAKFIPPPQNFLNALA